MISTDIQDCSATHRKLVHKISVIVQNNSYAMDPVLNNFNYHYITTFAVCIVNNLCLDMVPQLLLIIVTEKLVVCTVFPDAFFTGTAADWDNSDTEWEASVAGSGPSEQHLVAAEVAGQGCSWTAVFSLP